MNCRRMGFIKINWKSISSFSTIFSKNGGDFPSNMMHNTDLEEIDIHDKCELLNQNQEVITKMIENHVQQVKKDPPALIADKKYRSKSFKPK